MCIAILAGTQVSGWSDGRLEQKPGCSMRPAVPQIWMVGRSDPSLAPRPPVAATTFMWKCACRARAHTTEAVDGKIEGRRSRLTLRFVEWLEGQDPHESAKLRLTPLTWWLFQWQGWRVGLANECGSHDSHQTHKRFTGTAVVTTSPVGKCVRQVAINCENAKLALVLFPTRRNGLRDRGYQCWGFSGGDTPSAPSTTHSFASRANK